MLLGHNDEGKKREHLMHAPEEEYDESQKPSVFGTFMRSEDTSASNQSFIHGNSQGGAETSDDDSVRRPLFLSF